VRARIVAQLYERFTWRWAKSLRESRREGGEGSYGALVQKQQELTIFEDDDWPRIEDGVARMRQLDELFRQYDVQRMV
jgi:hypothetical protein